MMGVVPAVHPAATCATEPGSLPEREAAGSPHIRPEVAVDPAAVRGLPAEGHEARVPGSKMDPVSA